MTDRKVLLEVTHEEYEKIMNGALNVSNASTDELIEEIVRRTDKEDKRILHNPYNGIVTVSGTVRGNTKKLDYTTVEI